MQPMQGPILCHSTQEFVGKLKEWRKLLNNKNGILGFVKKAPPSLAVIQDYITANQPFIHASQHVQKHLAKLDKVVKGCPKGESKEQLMASIQTALKQSPSNAAETLSIIETVLPKDSYPALKKKADGCYEAPEEQLKQFRELMMSLAPLHLHGSERVAAFLQQSSVAALLELAQWVVNSNLLHLVYHGQLSLEQRQLLSNPKKLAAWAESKRHEGANTDAKSFTFESEEKQSRQTGVTLLPPEIQHYSELNSVFLKGHPLAWIPMSLGQLPLRCVYLTQCKLKAFPAVLLQCLHLLTIDLSKNAITEVPAGIKNLTHLTNLRLNDNRLNRITSKVCKLQGLRDLQLSNNQIVKLPAKIVKLKDLEKFFVNGNLLTVLPDLIQMRNLESFSAANNLLTDCEQNKRVLKHFQKKQPTD